MQDQHAQQVFLLEPSDLAIVPVVSARKMQPGRLGETILDTRVMMPKIDVLPFGIAFELGRVGKESRRAEGAVEDGPVIEPGDQRNETGCEA